MLGRHHFRKGGYQLHIRKTINNTISKLVKPIKQGPMKCCIYFRLPYLSKKAKALEKNVKNVVNSSFISVQLRISHFTRKPMNGIYKNVTADLEKK